MNSKYKDVLIKKYEDFNLEENQDSKKLLRFELFNILEEVEEPDSNDFHIWGLTYYLSDDDKEYHKNLALEKFLKAYELDSTNFLACLYVAHCFHDKGELDNALKYYELVDKKDLKEFQIWKYVKMIEQIGFCRYKLGTTNLVGNNFMKYLSGIENYQWKTELFQLKCFNAFQNQMKL